MKKLSKFIAAVFAVLLAFASCEVKPSEVNEPVLSGVKISSVDSSFSDIIFKNTESKIKFTIDLPAGTKKVNVEASSDNNVSFILFFNDEKYENNEIFELSQGSNRITIEVLGTTSKKYYLYLNVPESIPEEIPPEEIPTDEDPETPSYDVTVSSVKVNGTEALKNGTSYSFTIPSSEADSQTAEVVVSPSDINATVSEIAPVTVLSGTPSNVTFTVTNGTSSETYTLIVKYVKRATPPAPQSTQYWTNKDGAVGTYKTISSFSDWTEKERIAQGAAYDDPRTWKGVQEVPYDVYALYAAWDDTNLYLMYELCNIADDDIFMIHDYAGTDNANWDNRNIPIGFALNTGSSNCVTKPTITAQSKPIWGSIDFFDANGMDYILYHSSKYGFAEHKDSFVQVGTPGFFIADGTGFSYDEDKCLSVNTNTKKGTSGIDIRYTTGCVVTGSGNLKYECTPNDNRTTSGQTGADLMASTNYKTVSSKHNSARDMSYMYTIPLATIGITRAKLESEGIGVRQLTTNGGSLMDCLPWDPCMVDVASDECSDDKSTSAEKRDLDEITTPQARIGAM